MLLNIAEIQTFATRHYLNYCFISTDESLEHSA